MSGAQTSGFPNVLFNAPAAYNAAQQYQDNQLLMQQHQQAVTDHDIAAVGQAAAPLLGMSEDDAAKAYPGWLQDQQSRGIAKYAPPTYPGHAAVQALVQRAMPLMDQFKIGYITPPGTQAAVDAALRPGSTPTTAPASSGAPAPAVTPSGGATIGQRQNNPGNLTFAGQPGASPGQGNRFAAFPDMPTGVAANADQLALYQTQHGINTVRGAVTRWVGDPKADLGSYIGDISKALGVGPDDKIDLTNPDVQAKFIQAQFPHESAGGGFVLNPADVQKGVQMAAANRGRSVQATGTAIAPPAVAPGGVAARVGGTDMAGPGAGPGGAPGGDLVGPRVLPPIGPGSPVVTPQSLANTPAPQPQAQVPQPPANRVMPGSPDGPPAPTPPPAQQQPPPGARANLPRAADIPTGVNSQQYRDAADLQRRALILEAQVDPTGRLKQLAAGLRQQAQLLLQTDSVVQTQEGQLHPLTGQIGDPPKPLADYHETSPGSGIWVGGPGTEPRFQPPGRLIIDKAGDVWRTTTGGAEKLSRLDPAAVAALAAAQASGTALGTSTGKLPEQLANQGRDATQAIGNIDYGMSQIAKAKAGGINTGFFAPWLGTVGAIAKSIGGETGARLLGIDPAAVGNVQTAQKTLAVVSGAILQQVLGSDSQITDAKIAHFIHAQPGIETDPEALSRVLNWARSQFVYESEMSAQGMKDASETGQLPTNWRARYFRDHGFAPIYNPATGEMEQPDGGAPSREPPGREPPAAVTTAPVNPAAREVGKTYQTPKGQMKWNGTTWDPP